MGAASVEYLVHSPMIRQSHFQRVILMSGSMFSSWSRVDNPAENAVKLAKELGCPLPADLYTHHTNILECLRSENKRSIRHKKAPIQFSGKEHNHSLRRSSL